MGHPNNPMPLACCWIPPYSQALCLPQDLRMEVVRSLLGDLYHIFPLYVDMGDCGHAGATRRRVYVILAHKHMTDMITNPYNLYQNVVLDLRLKSEALDCQTTPGDYLTADHMEIQLDAMEVARYFTKQRRKVSVV